MLHKLGLYKTIAEFLILLDSGSKKNVSWSIKRTFSAEKMHSCGVVSISQHAKLKKWVDSSDLAKSLASEGEGPCGFI